MAVLLVCGRIAFTGGCCPRILPHQRILGLTVPDKLLATADDVIE